MLIYNPKEKSLFIPEKEIKLNIFIAFDALKYLRLLVGLNYNPHTIDKKNDLFNETAERILNIAFSMGLKKENDFNKNHNEFNLKNICELEKKIMLNPLIIDFDYLNSFHNQIKIIMKNLRLIANKSLLKNEKTYKLTSFDHASMNIIDIGMRMGIDFGINRYVDHELLDLTTI